jgi:glutathione S-transferase
MIKIYGPKQSSALRTLWTAEECGVEYENINVKMREGEHKTPEFLKLNPNAKVPVMVDGDLVLFESMAINTYLAEKYKPELLGNGIAEHGQVYQWSYWAIANMAHSFETLVMTRYGVVASEETLQNSRLQIAKYLTILNIYLEGKDYMVGSGFTIADVNVYTVVATASFVEIDLAPYPQITRWMAIHAIRPAFQKLTAQA